MQLNKLFDRIQTHLLLIAQEEYNVDCKRAILAQQKGFDCRQVFEAVKMSQNEYITGSNLSAFLTHYCVEFDKQFIDSFLYGYSGLIGFHLDYEGFKQFLIPCEDENLQQTLISKSHDGGARVVLPYYTRDALRDLFYAEVHYHFVVERSKKELFRDFGYVEHPLMIQKRVSKEQLELEEPHLERVWRRLNYMQRQLYTNSKHSTRNFKSIIYPEDYMNEMQLMKQPVTINEQRIPTYNKQKKYLKNKRVQGYIECPPQQNCQFYNNYDDIKTYSSDKFNIQYATQFH